MPAGKPPGVFAWPVDLGCSGLAPPPQRLAAQRAEPRCPGSLAVPCARYAVTSPSAPHVLFTLLQAPASPARVPLTGLTSRPAWRSERRRWRRCCRSARRALRLFTSPCGGNGLRRRIWPPMGQQLRLWTLPCLAGFPCALPGWPLPPPYLPGGHRFALNPEP